jgi:hypothetical protein
MMSRRGRSLPANASGFAPNRWPVRVRREVYPANPAHVRIEMLALEKLSAEIKAECEPAVSILESVHID